MVILMGLLLTAAVFDLLKARIPNRLILAGVFLGLIRMAVCRTAFLPHLFGILTPILFLFPFFSIGTLGAGDIKLISMIGFFLPSEETVFCILLAFGMAAVVGATVYLKEGILIRQLQQVISYLAACLGQGLALPYPGAREKQRIHLAPFIFIGAAILVGGDIG